ncbi:MAG: amidohydrolase family protein [Pyrinomonadaceae bacterium]
MRIYKAKYVLPVTSEPIEDGAVVVSGARIEAVGTVDEISASFTAPVLDLGFAAISPGFVNTHAHLELTGFRGSVDRFDGEFVKWLTEITKLRAEKETEQSLVESAILGAAEAASSGVTSIGDIGRSGFAGLKALRDVGLRGVVYQETKFSPEDATANADFDALLSVFEPLAEEYSGRVAVGISPHSPYTVSGALIAKISKFALENGVRISTHAAESLAEREVLETGTGPIARLYEERGVAWKAPKKSTVSYLDDLGLLETSPILAHCVHVSEEDIGILAGSTATVAHCPKSNLKLGHGHAPLSELKLAGITVGIGTDSMASNNSCDMFEEARFASLLSRLGGNGIFEPERIFRMMTIEGASALGLENETGSIERGKLADLTFISLDGIRQQPVYDVYSALLFATSADSVTHTMVDGRFVYEDRRLVNVVEDELKGRVRKLFR